MHAESRARPITIAILALGGEGGGVLTDWIVDLAEHEGYLAQKTSVPGVAQRTGATVYYVELFPGKAAAAQAPVLALMPAPGDVDIVLASEFMEAGRAIARGFVTPDRTTLITSTHRVYTMHERVAVGDERVDSEALLKASEESSARLYAFDMSRISESTGSLVTAVMFGALAAADALPFARAAFEATIGRGGVGVGPSVRAFALGFEAAKACEASAHGALPAAPQVPTVAAPAMVDAIASQLTPASSAVVSAGAVRLKDFQDEAYAELYIQRLKPIVAIDRARGSPTDELTSEVARALAVAMSFEDTIRVAQLKIRRSRFDRVREEVKAKPGEIVEIAEYFHPRRQEIVETVPAAMGRWINRTRWASAMLERVTRKGYTVRTSSIPGFLLLWMITRLKPMRRRSMRWIEEFERHEIWLGEVRKIAAHNYDLAVEVARCLELVTGYGDTHDRSLKKFNAIMSALPSLRERPDAPARVAALRKAAAADETGEALSRKLADNVAARHGDAVPVAA